MKIAEAGDGWQAKIIEKNFTKTGRPKRADLGGFGAQNRQNGPKSAVFGLFSAKTGVLGPFWCIFEQNQPKTLKEPNSQPRIPTSWRVGTDWGSNRQGDFTTENTEGHRGNPGKSYLSRFSVRLCGPLWFIPTDDFLTKSAQNAERAEQPTTDLPRGRAWFHGLDG